MKYELKDQNVYVILRSGQGDIYYDVITEAQYDEWPDHYDATGFIDEFIYNRLGKDEYKVWYESNGFVDFTDLLNYIQGNNLNVLGSVEGYIY